MRDMRKLFAATAIALSVSACGAMGSGKENTYKIEPEGGVETKDRSVYSSLGDVTFRMNQRYKISLMGEGDKSFHFLIVNVKKSVGNKNVDEAKGILIPISDGSYVTDCEHYYDVKIGKEEDTSPPVCDIEPIGTIYPNGSAKLLKSK